MNLYFCPCCHNYVNDNDTHVHHILPRSLGGHDEDHNRIKICHSCHGKIHNYNFMKHTNLVNEGLKKAKERGVRLGQPFPEKRLGMTEAEARVKVKEYRAKEISYRQISKLMDLSYGLAHKLSFDYERTNTNSKEIKETVIEKPARKIFVYENNDTCQICLSSTKKDEIHRHHILAVVLGGVDEKSNIISLCIPCHGKIHQRKMVGGSALIKEGLKKAKEKGIELGRPAKISIAQAELIVQMKIETGLSFEKIGNLLSYNSIFLSQKVPTTTIKHIFRQYKEEMGERYVFQKNWTTPRKDRQFISKFLKEEGKNVAEKEAERHRLSEELENNKIKAKILKMEEKEKRKKDQDQNKTLESLKRKNENEEKLRRVREEKKTALFIKKENKEKEKLLFLEQKREKLEGTKRISLEQRMKKKNEKEKTLFLMDQEKREKAERMKNDPKYREKIKEEASARVKAGLKRAKENGVVLGTPTILNEKIIQKVRKDREKLKLSFRALADKHDLSYGTVYKICS